MSESTVRVALVIAALLVVVIIVRGVDGSSFGSGPSTANYGPCNEYVVQPGDTMWGIAAHYGTHADTIASMNGRSVDSFIYAGECLNVP